jgi:hypothetical protein
VLPQGLADDPTWRERSAKRWLKSLREGDVEARARLDRAYPGAPRQPKLRDVLPGLARERGHESWIALTRAVADGNAASTPRTSVLSAAAKGEPPPVDEILDEHPGIYLTTFGPAYRSKTPSSQGTRMLTAPPDGTTPATCGAAASSRRVPILRSPSR